MNASTLIGRIVLAVVVASSWPATAQQRQQARRTSATRVGGLVDFNDDALISELAARGLDSLLERAFEVNNVPPDRRVGIKAFGALRELTNEAKPPTPTRRAALINQFVGGAKAVLPAQKDPVKLMGYASLLLAEIVKGDVNLIEFWGENPATQARLRPVIETILAMLDKAAEEADAQKVAVEKRMNNPNDRAAADAWMKLDEAAVTARYTRHMAEYYLAISLPRGDAGETRRAKIADGAIAFLKELDKAEYNLQPEVRNRLAKLMMAKRDYAGGKELFQTVVDRKNLTPAPTAFQQYEARYFSILCDLEAGKLDAARAGLAELLRWQKEGLPKDEEVQKGVTAAADMMQYRIHMAAADADRKAGSAEQAAKGEAAAIEMLMKLAERPDLKPIIFEQLVERMQLTGGMKQLDPLVLKALVQKGVTESDRPTNEKADEKVLDRAVEAAKELVKRKGSKGVDEQSAESAELFAGRFLERLGRKVEAANAYLDFLKKYPDSRRRGTAFDGAGYLIAMDLRRGPDRDSREVVDLWTRFLPLAVEKPFNRTDLMFDYAERLRTDGRYEEAAAAYARVPQNDPRSLPASHLQMISLYSLMLDTPPGAARRQLAREVVRLAEQVKKAYRVAVTRAADDKERARLQHKLAGATLTMAQVAAGEQNDAQRTLEALQQLEAEVTGLPAAQALLNQGLFLRVKSLMAVGQSDEATRTLVALLEKTGGQKGQEIVLGLLSRLNDDYSKAEASADVNQMRSLAGNRAQLSGFLVNWAKNNKNPDIAKQLYSYSVYDAESKLKAGVLAKDEKQLREALAAFQKLRTPEMVELYRREAAGNAKVDPEYPHPIVLLGTGLAAFELGDYTLAQENLGRLVFDRKLGSPKLEKVDEKTGETRYLDNENYWEAWYKLLCCNVELFKKNKDDPARRAAFESAKQGLKNMFIKGDVGGQKWKPAFDALKREIIPEFEPNTTAPATPPGAP